MDFNNNNTTYDELLNLVKNSELGENKQRELLGEIIESIDSIKFVKNIISTNIKRACDLDRDENNKIIVDISNPHKLEDMEYFCDARKHYQEHGCYTRLYKNRSPNSSYMTFWKQEASRIRNGMIREYDGEWIPGELYYYWNYSPILLTKKKGNTKRADRIKDFPNFWLGDYLWFHYMEQARDMGMHCTKLKMRGVGASFKSSILGNRKALLFKDSRFFYTAYDKQFLTSDGILNKAWDNLDFMASNTPFPRLRLRDTLMEKVIGYKDSETGAERGQKSAIIGVSSKDDPDKLRGKRGDILFEEHGVFPKLRETWSNCRDSVEDGDNVFGMLISQGTGGTESSDFEAAEDMFRYPESYNIFGIPNVFDKNSNGLSYCGFFWGAYLNRANCYDEQGNPDVIKALFEIHLERVKIKYSSSDSTALTKRKAEKPITPDECVLRIEGTVFPVGEIKEYIADIEIDRNKHYSDVRVGELIYNNDSSVSFKSNSNVYPIRDYPIKGKNRKGAIEILNKPPENPGNNRFGIGTDPLDSDYIADGSLASIYVWDFVLDKAVAWYHGRPQLADEFYEIALKLSIYYNARINYESNLKGMYGYFYKKNKQHLLIDTLKILKDQQLVKSTGIGNRSKGTPANKQINAWARKLFADYMLEERAITVNNEVVKSIKLKDIVDLGLLKEAAQWNVNGNFDRISAIGMIMLYREDVQKNINIISNSENSMSIYKDPIWDKF